MLGRFGPHSSSDTLQAFLRPKPKPGLSRTAAGRKELTNRIDSVSENKEMNRMAWDSTGRDFWGIMVRNRYPKIPSLGVPLVPIPPCGPTSQRIKKRVSHSPVGSKPDSYCSPVCFSPCWPRGAGGWGVCRYFSFGLTVILFSPCCMVRLLCKDHRAGSKLWAVPNVGMGWESNGMVRLPTTYQAPSRVAKSIVIPPNKCTNYLYTSPAEVPLTAGHWIGVSLPAQDGGNVFHID